MHIDGRIDGVIESDYDVSIGAQGEVVGLIKARTIVLSGVLEGKVACERIDILSGGKLIGELICGEVTIEAGGKFIGESRELTEGGLIVSLPEEERGQWTPAGLDDLSQKEQAGEARTEAAQETLLKNQA
ncbi:polymer-forming cytoskeletal protein [Thiomicrorhabdus sp. zzn3]|uniref:polymer-forming cytoskeletal protein n=1 Tax=Thiomicrorhabdus sp. zzn3 TaxID=3039775 RepID=UPI002436BD50|nr:polymer-forming cytoskeletal protein [Thiomicrorhabdus sp. zzn3]MDG6778351.1 polymer-forming cytoskeletal protein [Thiomicrorhabdus sp. zzn3]